MKTFTVLVLFLTLSSASGLKCYSCSPTHSQPCSKTVDCNSVLFNRCSRVEASGTVTQTCMRSELCISPMTCCEQDLCNSFLPTAPSVLLLTLTSIALFL